jgi:hypothetical protein
MKAWKVILFSTLITLAIGGIYLFSVWKHRQDPGIIAKSDTNDTLSKDDLAVVRAFFPQHFADTLRLEGTTVWMKNGYTISYFPYSSGHVEFTKRVGVIPSAQPLEIKKIIKAAVPADVDDGIGHGSRQVLAVFALPDKDGQFAVPIGTIDGADEQYYCDLLFYYDDPHKIYDYWPKDVWAAIDAHQVKPGMIELETRLAIGQSMHPDSQTEGNRTVTYDQDGKNWTVTFVKDRATEIKGG